jgi:queuosine precursor transporter
MQAAYLFITLLFCLIVFLSNLLSAKFILLPFFDLNIPAGLLTYPLTFLLSALVTEIFGAKKGRQMVYSAFGVSILIFAILQLTLFLFPQGLIQEHSYKQILNLSSLRIIASLTAYLAAHIIDIQLYAVLKRWTGNRLLWLRNNGATWVAQGVDTVIVDTIYLYGVLGMGLSTLFPIMGFSYLYKAFFSVATTPLFYLLLFLMRAKEPRHSARTRE